MNCLWCRSYHDVNGGYNDDDDDVHGIQLTVMIMTMMMYVVSN